MLYSTMVTKKKKRKAPMASNYRSLQTVAPEAS